MKKILVLLMCLSMILCTVACNRPDTDKNPSDGGETPVPMASSYEGIIEKYGELLRVKKDGGDLFEIKCTYDDERESDIFDALISSVTSCEDVLSMGYAIKDVNGDGIFELVLMSKNCKLYALFTLKDSLPILLDTFNANAVIDEYGTVIVNVREETKMYSYCKQIKGDELVGMEFIQVQSENDPEKIEYYKLEGGVRTDLTYSEYSHYTGAYCRVNEAHFEYATKIAGFRFMPIFTEDGGEVPESIDFSSYESILEIYKNIVDRYSGFTKKRWIEGKYDGMYSFANDEEYEWWHQMFYYGWLAAPTTYVGYPSTGDNAYGYAIKDLNGDSVEELILMTDNCEIISIFTKKDGKPVLLSGDIAGNDCWIDENGLIRVEKWTGGLTGRDAEYYLYKIEDGELLCVFGIGSKRNIYLEHTGFYKIENGERSSISKEEWEELYAQFDVVEKVMMFPELTKSFAGLDFIELYKESYASSFFAGKRWSNMGIVYGEEVEITAASKESITFSLNRYGFTDNSAYRIYIVEDGVAKLENGVYVYEDNEIKLSFDFNVITFWVNIEESKDENFEPGVYLMNSDFDLRY